MTKPISPRRKCVTCVREWCLSMRTTPEEKEQGCMLWRRKGEGSDA